MSRNTHPDFEALRSRRRAVGHVILAWSLAYMLPHLYWAAGGTAGFAALHPSIRDLPQWRTINWIASPILTAAGLLGLALARSQRPSLRNLLFIGALFGCSVGVAHGVVGITLRLQTIMEIRSADESAAVAGWLLWDLLVFEPWFLIEGLLFGVAGYLLAENQRTQRRWLAACAAGVAVGLVTAFLRVKAG